MEVLKGRYGDTLVDRRTGATCADEYMDPAHLQLGDEGYLNLQKQRVEEVGSVLLERIRARLPELRAYADVREGHIFEVHGGKFTQIVYLIRTRSGGLLRRFFPKTLAAVVLDNGIMPWREVAVNDERLIEVAQRLAEDYPHFKKNCPGFCLVDFTRLSLF